MTILQEKKKSVFLKSLLGNVVIPVLGKAERHLQTGQKCHNTETCCLWLVICQGPFKYK